MEFFIIIKKKNIGYRKLLDIVIKYSQIGQLLNI